MPITDRKKSILSANNKIYDKWEYWGKKNTFYHEEDIKYLKFIIPENKKVLDLGCGTGNKLNSLNPSLGIGIDFSEKAINIARKKYKNLKFLCEDIETLKTIDIGDFDYILISDLVGDIEDLHSLFNKIHNFCSTNTRIVISYYSALWWPILKLAESFKLKIPTVEKNWLRTKDIENLLEINNFQIVKNEKKQLLPKRLFGLGKFVNKFIATLPIIDNLSLSRYIVSRSLKHIDVEKKELSTSIIIPCKNEKDNIAEIIKRIPNFCKNLEIIFVEGGSTDKTYEEIKKNIKKNKNLKIKVYKQDNLGKANAVIKGFNKATNEVLMILDADMTVPPEDLPKFYKLYCDGVGEFINGSRMVYPLEKDSMRFLNIIGNFVFSKIFTWLLRQRFTDTLCGTKVLSKSDFKKIEKSCKYFGNFDPFGDFLLIFGAVKENLKIVELPIKYKKRVYGTTQISRFKHGIMLFKMVIFAYFKIKAI